MKELQQSIGQSKIHVGNQSMHLALNYSLCMTMAIDVKFVHIFCVHSELTGFCFRSLNMLPKLNMLSLSELLICYQSC